MAAKLKREERRVTVASMIKGRASYRQIAFALGCAPATVCKDVKLIIGRWREEQVSDIEEQILLDNATINEAIHAIWDDVKSGDVVAIGALVKLLDRRARLLGLDAPARSPVAIGGTIDVEAREVPSDAKTEIVERYAGALDTFVHELIGGDGGSGPTNGGRGGNGTQK